MSDSVDVFDRNPDTGDPIKRNAGSIEAAEQAWLDNNNPTSIDFVKEIKLGGDRMAVRIMYTA